MAEGARSRLNRANGHSGSPPSKSFQAIVPRGPNLPKPGALACSTSLARFWPSPQGHGAAGGSHSDAQGLMWLCLPAGRLRGLCIRRDATIWPPRMHWRTCSCCGRLPATTRPSLTRLARFGRQRPLKSVPACWNLELSPSFPLPHCGPVIFPGAVKL